MTLTDDQVREMAKDRVDFKQHLAAYVIVNLMLIGIWALTTGPEDGYAWRSFWPIWTIFFWGVGLTFHSVNVYSGGKSMVAREEERIRKKYD